MTVTLSQLLEAAEPRALLEPLRQRGECEQLAEAQWSSIVQVAKAGRDVRRVSFHDGRASYSVNVAIEKDEAGRVEVRLTKSRSVLTASVPLEAWNALIRRDRDTKDLPRLPSKGVVAPPPFHCPSLTIEISRKGASRVRNVSRCNARDSKAWAYGVDIAKVATTYISACKDPATSQRLPARTGIETIDQLTRCGGAVAKSSF